MAREITKAQREAVYKYEKANYDHTRLRLPKGTLDTIKAAAADAGMSQNAYIVARIMGEAAPAPQSQDSGGLLAPETIATAAEAAQAAGVDTVAWIRGAIETQAQRDALLRRMK